MQRTLIKHAKIVNEGVIFEGDILIDDYRVNDMEPSDRDIALVFQSYALYPAMTVKKNVTFGLEQRKTPKDKIEESLNRVSSLLKINELLERKPSQLSGGQRQRVAMGRAIVRSPQAFLMDEPLSNLDAKLRVQMRAELGELHSQLETTTLYVTHDQVEAMTMGDRVAVIRKGVLQQIDTPREIYLYPKNIFVAGFIGSPAMNFVYATIDVSDSTFQSNLYAEINHGLGTADIIVQLYDINTEETVIADVFRTDKAGTASTDKIKIVFSAAPAAANDIRVLITSLKGGQTGTVAYS